jgi:hypothetical protein
MEELRNSRMQEAMWVMVLLDALCFSATLILASAFAAAYVLSSLPDFICDHADASKA